jgi:hypothetical protein
LIEFSDLEDWSTIITRQFTFYIDSITNYFNGIPIMAKPTLLAEVPIGMMQ